MVDIPCIFWQVFLAAHNQLYCESHGEIFICYLQNLSINTTAMLPYLAPIIKATKYVYINNPVVSLVLDEVIDHSAW